ncbi:amidohydrolase [Myxococcus virescens]|uniref:amidohydrolase n=1 Tax=Myxococcus virescens TaxID=83456 RepID=UPI003DA3BD18
MHHSHPTCTHCGCNNPLMDTLGEELLTTDAFSRVPAEQAARGPEVPESLLIYGGIIRPMINGSTEVVEAIGIHQGQVVAAGKRAAVEAEMQKRGISFNTHELNATETLLPGLIEPHVHIVASAMMAGFPDMGAFEGQFLRSGYNENWLSEQLKAEADSHHRSDDWVLGREVDPALMPFTVNPPGELNKLVTIDADFLDRHVPNKPVLLLSASMHTAYLNTAALKLTYENSTDLQKKFDTFEDYKDSNKGQLQEIPEMQPALAAIPRRQMLGITAQAVLNLARLFETAAKRGVTMLYDAGLNPVQLKVLKAYLKVYKSHVRIGGAKVILTPGDIGDDLKPYEPVAAYEDLYIGHLKVVSDGSNQGLTGYQNAEYRCDPAKNRGNFNFPNVAASQPDTMPPEFADLVQKAVNKNWSLMIHANGDKAIEFTTQAYVNALKSLSPEQRADRCDRIEHCSLLSPEQLNTMSTWGISPSFLIGHVGYWGYAFDKAIFEKDKARTLDLCKSALDRGLRITFHCDYSVSPLGPLRQMEQAITRIMEADPDQGVLNEDERLTPEQALRAVTYDAAWHCRAENWVGSLKPGHLADFVVLQQDPLSMGKKLPSRGHGHDVARTEQELPPVQAIYQQMRDIKVLSTWKGGVRLYAAKD